MNRTQTFPQNSLVKSEEVTNLSMNEVFVEIVKGWCPEDGNEAERG